MIAYTAPRVRRAQWAAFAATLLLAALALFPLSLAIRLLGLDQAGLSARAARGSVWGGALDAARFGPVDLGNVRVRLQLLPLLVGRARVDFNGAIGSGGISVSPGRRGVDDVTAVLPPLTNLGLLAVDRVALDDLSVAFADGRCVRAEGRVRLTLAGGVAGLALPGGLSGTARCEGRELVAPLVGQSGLETLTLRIDKDGRYRARLAIRATDPALGLALGALGFRPGEGGYATSFAGQL